MMIRITEGLELIQEIVRRRWIPEIIAAIAGGNQSYSEILAGIDYLSKTELNRKLNFLLERGVIEKQIKLNKTEYKLLPFGEDLEHIFKHFEDIGKKYLNRSIT